MDLVAQWDPLTPWHIWADSQLFGFIAEDIRLILVVCSCFAMIFAVLDFSVYYNPSTISTHSKPCTRRCMRLLKCFVLITLSCKTKHLKMIVKGIIQGFE